MEKIPSASEFRKNKKIHQGFTFLQPDQIENVMIEFAKLHVKAALKEALESIPCLGSSSDIATYDEVKNAVLKAYPEELIK